MATTGVEAFQRDDYATAVDKLTRAYQVLPAPSIALWLARTHVKQGHWVAASERYLEAGRLAVGQGDADVQQNAKKEAAAELAALLPKIPSVVVTLQGATSAEVTISLDGAPLAAAFVGEDRPVDPGKHHVEGRRGAQLVAVDVVVEQGEKKAVALRFDAASAPAAAAAASPGSEPAADGKPASVAPVSASNGDQPAAKGSTRKVVAWSLLGFGGAGLITGGIAGALAIGKKSELEASPNCAEHQCLRSSMQDELDSYGTLRTVSSVGFIAGGVLAATGLVLLVTAPKPESASAPHRSLRIRVGERSIWAEGTF